MATVNTQNTTSPNGAAKFNDIVYKDWFVKTLLNRLFTILQGQKDGAAVVGVKPFRILGKKSQGCNPDYNDSSLDAVEKKWDIKEWEVAEEMCYDDINDTIFEEVMNTGIDAANIIDTRYYKEIVQPALIDGIDDMIFRFAYFGDTGITASELQVAGDVEHFNLIDGIWKQIFDAVTAGTISRTAIDANTKTTSAAQMSAMVPGSKAAVNLMSKIILDAPIKLRQAKNKVLYISQALYDAYVMDKQSSFVGSEGQWNSLENGIMQGYINGVETIVVPEWDNIIQNFLKNTTNAGAFDNPFRAIFTTKDNILLGTESNGDFKKFIAGFDDKNQINWFLAKNTLGAMVHFDEMTHVAF